MWRCPGICDEKRARERGDFKNYRLISRPKPARPSVVSDMFLFAVFRRGQPSPALSARQPEGVFLCSGYVHQMSLPLADRPTSQESRSISTRVLRPAGSFTIPLLICNYIFYHVKKFVFFANKIALFGIDKEQY